MNRVCQWLVVGLAFCSLYLFDRLFVLALTIVYLASLFKVLRMKTTFVGTGF